MNYQEYKTAALHCANYAEVDQLIKIIADDETISSRQYCALRYIAIKAAYLSEAGLPC